MWGEKVDVGERKDVGKNEGGRVEMTEATNGVLVQKPQMVF